LKPALSASSTKRRFGLFVAFSLVAILFYNSAVLDRTFAAILSYMIIWITSPGTEIDEQEEEIEPSEDPSYDTPGEAEHEQSAHR
jgi:hypothetical protein